MDKNSWKRDKLRPTQPFFVLDSDEFLQLSYRHMGISHFYNIKKKASHPIRTIPDGCIDFIFSYGKKGFSAVVSGTPLSVKESLMPDATDIFGVRFMPGTRPEGLEIRLRDIIGARKDLEEEYKDIFDFHALAHSFDFRERIDIFLREYGKIEMKKEKPFGKTALFRAVRDIIYKADGQIRVSDLSDITGYSERYIREVFMDEMGFSPKTFCDILRFQRTIEFINYGYDEKTADWVSDLGYYDQSQCIRDFKKYAGLTPRCYKKLVTEGHYRERVKNIEE